MVALDVSPPRFVHLSDGGRGLERFAERADDGALTIDFLDLFDSQLPAVALHHPGVADLAAGLRVERILFQDYLEVLTGLAERDRLRLGFRSLVANPLLLSFRLYLDPFAALSPPFAALRRRLSRRPRSAPLLPERPLKAFHVHRVVVLGSDHLREIERKTIGVVQLERILTRNHGLVAKLFHPREPPF